MQMTVEEIIRSYTQAKDKSKQIGILADLNGCDKEKIRSILRTRGVELPTKGRPKKTDVKKTTWPKADPKIEDLVQKDEFESPMRPLEATIEGGVTTEITFINKDTGEKTTRVFGKLKQHKEEPVLPNTVRNLIENRIHTLEVEKMNLTLEQEELEDFLESFNE